MVVEKVINNNLVRSLDAKGREVLVMGKGLGFKQQKGNSIDDEKIEKIYTLQNEDIYRHMEEVLKNVSLECIQATNEIVEYGKISLGKSLDDMIYLGLCDHISFALERHRNGVKIHNALLSETKEFYSGEYMIGEEALKIIHQKLGVQLPEDEAGFIALHFVNASMNLHGMEKTKEMMDLIHAILTIIKYHYQIELDETSIHYDRFITHLKYFIRRVFQNEEIDEGDESFYLMIRNQYKNAYVCSMKIQDYIRKQYHKDLTEDEMTFLTVHIDRVTKLKNRSV